MTSVTLSHERHSNARPLSSQVKGQSCESCKAPHTDSHALPVTSCSYVAKSLSSLALTQHKQPFSDDGTMCIRMLSPETAVPLHHPFRAGGWEKRRQLAAQAVNTQTQPSSKHTITIGLLDSCAHTTLQKTLTRERERVAVTFNNCPTTLLSHGTLHASRSHSPFLRIPLRSHSGCEACGKLQTKRSRTTKTSLVYSVYSRGAQQSRATPSHTFSPTTPTQGSCSSHLRSPL